MGVRLQDRPVHEGPGVALVGVADDVLLLGGHFGHARPLETRRIAAAAAPAQPAGGHFAQDLGGGHLGQGLDHGRVAAHGDVALEALRVYDPGVLQDYALLAGEEGGIQGLTQPLHRGGPQAGGDVCGVGGGHIPVQQGFGDVLGMDRHQGPGGAQPHAAYALDLAGEPLGDGALEGIEDRCGPGGLATGGHAHPHLMLQVRVQGAYLFGHVFQVVEIHCSISLRRANRSGPVTLPRTVPSRTTAGARPQAPTQRALSTDRALSGVVSPGLTP